MATIPHHQDARFQTKDLAGIALGEQWITGMLDEYGITLDGRLRRHVHERLDGPSAFLSVHMKSVRDWWEDIYDAHGEDDAGDALQCSDEKLRNDPEVRAAATADAQQAISNGRQFVSLLVWLRLPGGPQQRFHLIFATRTALKSVL